MMIRRILLSLGLAIFLLAVILGVVYRGSTQPVALAAIQTEQIPAASEDLPRYDIGNPTVQDIWVDIKNGNDANSGITRTQALKTISAAWNKIPTSVTLTTTGYRINLLAGNYVGANVLPNSWKDKRGTLQFPIIIRSADAPGSAQLSSSIVMTNIAYLYWLDVTLEHYQNILRCDKCDHVLIRGTTFLGNRTDPNSHWAIRFNQSNNIFIESNTITGTNETAVQFNAVQYGHLVNNRITSAGEACLVVRGGSAYLRIEGNWLSLCDQVGFAAGDLSPLEEMTLPWLHYEAYDIRFVNNIIYESSGTGMAVRGGYNILLAYNTLYKIGQYYQLMEFIQGNRSCDDLALKPQCKAYLLAGGWGTSSTTADGEPIPNRNVFVLNNIFYNPNLVYVSPQHLYVEAGQETSTGSNIKEPSLADDNLVIKGNVIWNVSGPFFSATLGLDPDTGCLNSNPTCNEAQIKANNKINSEEPKLVNPDRGDYRLQSALQATPIALPSFPSWEVLTPTVPAGPLVNNVTSDRDGVDRTGRNSVGAHGIGAAQPTNTPIPTNTSTPDPVQITLTPPTYTATPTVTNTPLVPDTPTMTPTQVLTGTVTATPTPTGTQLPNKVYLPSTSR